MAGRTRNPERMRESLLDAGLRVAERTGLGWLTYVWMDRGLPELARAALGVFVLAAMGGFTLFLGFHLRSKPLPIWMVLGHGLVALLGVVLLAMARFGGA